MNDEQSEFLKTLIVQEQQQQQLRRHTAIVLYLSSEDVVAMAEKLSINLSELEDRKIVRDKLEDGEANLSSAFCRLVALCALKLDDEYLKEKTLEYVDRLVDTSERQFGLTRGSVKCVLGRFEEGLPELHRAVGRANESGDTAYAMKCKNNFVYYLTDWSVTARLYDLPKTTEQERWESVAREYADQLVQEKSAAKNLDTLGFYWIVFGSPKEIDEGRALLRASKGLRPDDRVYEQSFCLHEEIALRRLRRAIPWPS